VWITRRTVLVSHGNSRLLLRLEFAKGWAMMKLFVSHRNVDLHRPQYTHPTDAKIFHLQPSPAAQFSVVTIWSVLANREDDIPSFWDAQSVNLEGFTGPAHCTRSPRQAA